MSTQLTAKQIGALDIKEVMIPAGINKSVARQKEDFAGGESPLIHLLYDRISDLIDVVTLEPSRPSSAPHGASPHDC